MDARQIRMSCKERFPAKRKRFIPHKYRNIITNAHETVNPSWNDAARGVKTVLSRVCR